MTITRLSEAEIESAVAGLDGWTLVGGKLHRAFEFADFVEAFGFMARCALVAESRQHHPEWSNVYNKVVVDLTTHDAGGISELDVALATTMNELAAGSATA